jgi:plastocyanin
VAGPDGNLWITESSGSVPNIVGKVAKVTTAGVFTEYPMSAGGIPFGIAAGPDGNLWLTEAQEFGTGVGSRVAKVTTSGVFTEYVAPTASSPDVIMAGPDGNLWLTEGFATKAARVTNSGVFTEYAPPGGSGSGVAAGPDGNVWFTELNGKQVAKIVAAQNVGIQGTSPADFAFAPSSVTVSAGDTVRWTNNSPVSHTVTQCDNANCPVGPGSGTNPVAFNSGPLSGSGSGSFKQAFNAAGTYNYYCNIHGYGVMHGTVTANMAITTPVVTTQPANQTVTAGATASFASHASGSPPPTVQWQVSTNGGATFMDMPAATSDTLTVPSTTVAMSGNEYLAVFTNSACTATSSVATLTVNPTTANGPRVTGVSPRFGIADCGGTRVRIRGPHFKGATSVRFGSKPAVSFRVRSDGLIVAIAPAEPAGTVDVTITTPNGTSPASRADHFTYRSRDRDQDRDRDRGGQHQFDEEEE